MCQEGGRSGAQMAGMCLEGSPHSCAVAVTALQRLQPPSMAVKPHRPKKSADYKSSPHVIEVDVNVPPS